MPARLATLPHQVSQGVGVVKAGVTGGCNDLCQVIGRQAEVGNILKGAVCVLDMHPVVLQHQPGGSAACKPRGLLAVTRQNDHADAAQMMRQATGNLQVASLCWRRKEDSSDAGAA